VARGVRAQTQFAGITGQQHLSPDFFDPANYPPLPFDWTPKYEYVPSAPSFATELFANAQQSLANLNEADIKDIGQNLNKLIVTANTQLDRLDLDRLSADADDVLKDARAAINRIDRILAAAPIDDTALKLDSASTRLDKLLANPGLERTVDNLGDMTGRLRKRADSGELDRIIKRLANAADRLDRLIDDNQYDVRVMVQDLRVTADNLRTLSENIKRYPADALVYRMQDVQYTSDSYNAFIAEPAAIRGSRMAERLDRAGPFRTVGQPGSSQPAPYVLEATVTELYGDFRPGQAPAAMLAVQFALIDVTGTRSSVVLQCTLSSRVELPEASPDALVRAVMGRRSRTSSRSSLPSWMAQECSAPEQLSITPSPTPELGKGWGRATMGPARPVSNAGSAPFS
jgi:hypothetical protein